MVDHCPNDETVLRQPAACPKCGALPAIVDHGWYATHRAKVEADHAAAKDDEAEGLRPLTSDEIEAGSYLLTRDLRRDMGRMDWGALRAACREEPDADTKREVAEMMDGLTGRIGAQP